MVDVGFVASFERLVVAEQASVLRAARRVTGRLELAEDAAQEALLHALRQGPRVLAAREPGRVLRWLATRHACMELRARKRIDASCGTDAAMGLAQGREVGPERADELLRVKAELARLPRALGEALALRFAEGATYQAIALRLGISEATAHSRVRRGLEALRLRLGPRRSGLGAWSLWGWPGASTWRALWNSVRGTTWVRRGLRGLAASASMAASVGFVVWGMGRGASGLPSFDAAVAPTVELAPPASSALGVDEPSSLDPFDRSTWGRRVPLSAYLDAGGSLPPFAPPSVSAPPARLLGRVLDDRGQRLRDALVELEVAVPGVDLALSVARTTTDASGDFVLDDVPAATALTLRVRFANATIVQRPIELEPGAAVALGTLVAGVPVDTTAGAFTVDITVKDARGKPVADAIVTLARRHLDLSGWTAIARDDAGRTDRNGRILLDGRWLGRKRVELRHGGATLVHDISIESDGTHGLELIAPAITPD